MSLHGKSRHATIIMKRSTLCRCIVLLLSTTVADTWACSLKDPRQQIAVLARFDTTPMQLPQELSLRAGDLFSILMPRNTSIRIVDANDQDTNAVMAIKTELHRRLSRHNGGKAPIEISAGHYPAHLAWRHFVARLPGTAYLILTADNGWAQVRVHMDEAPVVSRGQNWVWSNARQDDTILLSPSDTLTLNLPGEAGDGWRAEIAGRPVAVTGVSMLPPDTDASSARVLKTADILRGAREGALTIWHAGRDTYHFTVQRIAETAC